MFGVRTFVKCDGARYTDGLAALPGVEKVHDLAIAHEHVDRGAGGRHLAPVEEGQASIIPFENQHEAAATDTGTLWLDKAKHRVRGDRGVHGVTALLQHFHRSVGGMGVCGCRHRTEGPSLAPGRRRRRRLAGTVGRCAPDMDEEEREQEQAFHQGPGLAGGKWKPAKIP